MLLALYQHQLLVHRQRQAEHEEEVIRHYSVGSYHGKPAACLAFDLARCLQKDQPLHYWYAAHSLAAVLLLLLCTYCGVCWGCSGWGCSGKTPQPPVHGTWQPGLNVLHRFTRLRVPQVEHFGLY